MVCERSNKLARMLKCAHAYTISALHTYKSRHPRTPCKELTSNVIISNGEIVNDHLRKPYDLFLMLWCSSFSSISSLFTTVSVICQDSAADLGLVTLLLKCFAVISQATRVDDAAAKQFKTKCILALSICIDQSGKKLRIQSHIIEAYLDWVWYVITTVYRNKGKYQKELVRTQRENKQTTWEAPGKMPITKVRSVYRLNPIG